MYIRMEALLCTCTNYDSFWSEIHYRLFTLLDCVLWRVYSVINRNTEICFQSLSNDISITHKMHR